ncbi:hypothetical protein GCM10022384_05270 [Streptomyces marokkonensis]|uniref:Uncharacterized protein n=1 Tax=Streptomyces marokkonensis TaxID=324855 RepID=A0ABP7NW03_9ACTN
MVDVQFGLRQTGDEGVQIARDVGVDEVLWHGFLPGTAPRAGVGRRDTGDRLIGGSGIIVGRSHVGRPGTVA